MELTPLFASVKTIIVEGISLVSLLLAAIALFRIELRGLKKIWILVSKEGCHAEPGRDLKRGP